MSTRSLSSKMAKSAAKSAAKLTASVSTGDESSLMDMILMGAGVAVIILLLVYIYNRFIHKQPAKNEYFDGAAAPSVDTSKCPTCVCGNKADNSGKPGKLICGMCEKGQVRDKNGMCVSITKED
jgi:hypothetical protein